MRITKVTLENWGPYRGVQEVDIEVTDTSPLVVIWGGNGFGKTKFIDGLKWVFAGGEFGHIKVGPYINFEAIEAGDVFTTRVTVEFTDKGETFRASRSLEVDPAELEEPSDPRLLKRLQTMPDRTVAQLEKVGNAAYTTEQARLVLMRLFPARLVNFYFFDAAELIDSFKDMSGDKGSFTSTMDIQNSVETAMGFKGFESLLGALKELEGSLRDKADSEVKNKKQLGELKSRKDEASRLKSVYESDLRESEVKKDSASLRCEEQQRLLDGMGENLELQREISELEGLIAGDRRRIQELRQSLARLLPEIWAAPLSGFLTQESASLRLKTEELSAWRRSVDTQRARVDAMEIKDTDLSCPSCGREMDRSHKDSLEARLKVEIQKLEDLESKPPFDPDASLGHRLEVFEAAWSRTSQDAFRDFVTQSRELETCQVSVASNGSRIAAIKLQIGETGKIDFVAIFNEVQGLKESITSYEANIDHCRTEIAKKEDEIAGLDRQILKLSTASGGQSGIRMRKVQKLSREMSYLLQELKNKVRTEIEREANVILQSLVSEQDAQFSLKLGADYTISSDKLNPNAGFKQQIILSLLFAIPRVASAPFPVVIDSPLQHMDASNRSNFLMWCTTGLNQLVLLPHDAELAIDDVPEIFGAALSRFYELKHDPIKRATSVVSARD